MIRETQGKAMEVKHAVGMVRDDADNCVLRGALDRAQPGEAVAESALSIARGALARFTK